MRSIVITLVLFVGTLGGGVAWSKPQSPLSVSITPESRVVLGQPARFVVRLSSQLTAPSLHLQIDGPVNWLVHSGNTRWSGGLQAGETREFVIECTLPEQGQPLIRVKAWGDENGRVTFSASDRYLVPRLSGKAVMTPHGIPRPRHGGAVMEYPLDSSR